MGEIREDDVDPAAEWQSMIEFAEQHGRFRDMAAKLRAAGPPPSGDSTERNVPLIVDTDIGGDPDDAVAVAVAALQLPSLALVLTTDERGGDRARFARYFLDLMGRTDVPVVSGADLGNTRYYCVGGLFPDDVPSQSSNVLSAVDAVCAGADGPIRWVGMGPVSNLARVLEARPDLATRLVITQMGGALNYRDPARAEHNFRLDPDSVKRFLTTSTNPHLVISDATFTPANEITRDSSLYQKFAATDAPDWEQVLKTHMDRWFAAFYPGSMQHDALTLAAALEHPAVYFTTERVAVDGIGRMSQDTQGVEVRLSSKVDYEGFWWWLERQFNCSA